MSPLSPTAPRHVSVRSSTSGRWLCLLLVLLFACGGAVVGDDEKKQDLGDVVKNAQEENAKKGPLTFGFKHNIFEKTWGEDDFKCSVAVGGKVKVNVSRRLQPKTYSASASCDVKIVVFERSVPVIELGYQVERAAAETLQGEKPKVTKEPYLKLLNYKVKSAKLIAFMKARKAKKGKSSEGKGWARAKKAIEKKKKSPKKSSKEKAKSVAKKLGETVLEQFTMTEITQNNSEIVFSDGPLLEKTFSHASISMRFFGIVKVTAEVATVVSLSVGDYEDAAQVICGKRTTVATSGRLTCALSVVAAEAGVKGTLTFIKGTFDGLAQAGVRSGHHGQLDLQAFRTHLSLYASLSYPVPRWGYPPYRIKTKYWDKRLASFGVARPFTRGFTHEKNYLSQMVEQAEMTPKQLQRRLQIRKSKELAKDPNKLFEVVDKEYYARLDKWRSIWKKIAAETIKKYGSYTSEAKIEAHRLLYVRMFAPPP